MTAPPASNNLLLKSETDAIKILLVRSTPRGLAIRRIEERLRLVGAQPQTRVEAAEIFFTFFAHNPLKSPDSEK